MRTLKATNAGPMALNIQLSFIQTDSLFAIVSQVFGRMLNSSEHCLSFHLPPNFLLSFIHFNLGHMFSFADFLVVLLHDLY